MQSLITAYLAAFMFAFRAHHIISGPSFVADHELIGGFYTAYLTETDGLIELAMADGMIITEAAAQTQAAKSVSMMPMSHVADSVFASLQRIEAELRQTIDALLKDNAVSTGMQNYLQGLANTSLARSYKIKQRLG